MAKYILSLQRDMAEAAQVVEARGVFGALWPLQGTPVVEGTVAAAPGAAQFLQGRCFIRSQDGPASWLRFSLSETAPAQALLAEEVEIDPALVLLRLDTVTFPAGASAWRHVHPGPGIRHLLQGELALEADDHGTTLRAGESWFEAAHSPVKATASAEFEKSGFLRFMVLPVALQGQPSIQILDPADAERPRLQVTHRFIDQVVRLPHGS